ncbi:nitroreductase-like protein [Proteobacteria bacterium 005FR1]|nr:nitroreductase-like protein [Proteobacteria bacterium 005FR1]
MRDLGDFVTVRVFSTSAFLASVYYCFFSRKFRREHRAVLLGRAEYARSLRATGENRALLRRNIHRLEKGLVMRPRRPVFAQDYILETVKCFVNARRNSDIYCDEVKWAADVLTEYFKVVATTDLIAQAKALFDTAVAQPTTDRFTPYPFADLPAVPFSYAELHTLFKRRRSVRWYLNTPVEETKLNQAIESASLAPSACNRQPYRFHVINDPKKAEDVANCAMGTIGFASNLPCVIAVVGDLSAYPAERDRHIIYIDGSMATMQLMLSLVTLGLASCPINWPDIESREKLLASKLGLAYHERVIMLVAVGYADPEGGVPYSQKKSYSDLVVDSREKVE